MVIRGRHFETRYTIALRGPSLTVEIGDRAVIACDRGGRLYSLFRDGRMHRRSLNGRVIQKWHDRRGRHHRWLRPFEADVLVEDASLEFLRTLEAIRSRFWTWEEPPPADAMSDLLEGLERGSRFDSRAGHADAIRFEQIYGEVGILPPDHYLSLVLQATDGCLFGTCTFCHLYGRKFRVRSRAEFARHIDQVLDYFGDSLDLRRGAVFLGAANAIAVPMPRLVHYFEEIHARLGRPPRGIHAFADGFTGARKTVADYRALAELGLSRVYVGLESGDDALLEAVGKPSRSGDVLDTVAALKAAGVNVGIMVMVGLGGERFAGSHVARTADVVNRMNLDDGDRLYFSDLDPDSGYPARIPDQNGGFLQKSEKRRERGEIVDRLRFGSSPPKMAGYGIREFVY